MTPNPMFPGVGSSFEADEIFAFPEKVMHDARTHARAPKSVCVIGGGIAGLVAAYELAGGEHQPQGDSVTVLEASARWGGRLITAHLGSAHGELGAMRIPENHGCTRHYLETVFRLKVRPFVGESRLLLLGDKVASFEDLRRGKVGPPFTVWQQPTRGRPRFTADPFKMLDALIQPLAELFDDADWRAAFGIDDLQGSTIAKQAEMLSVWQVLSGRLRLPGPIPDYWLPPPLPSRPDWSYIGLASGQLWMEKASLLQWLVDGPRAISGGKVEPIDGMDALIKALVADLDGRDRVQLLRNASARRVVVEEDDERPADAATKGSGRVTVEWNGGKETFDFVLCAIPAPAVATIDFSPALDPEYRNALTNLSYIPMAKAVVHCSKRRWEQSPAGFVGGGSYTNHVNQQVWYPSDNAAIGAEEGGNQVDDEALDFSPDAPYPDMPDDVVGGHLPAGHIAKSPDPAAAESECVLTAAYVWGTNARRFTAMTGQERRTATVGSLEAMHPGISRDLGDMEFATFDSNDLGGGAFAYFAPGEQGRYQGVLGSSHPRNSATPQVFFAGEHLLPMHGWIQTSIQTALAAVRAIFQSPRHRGSG